MDVFNAYISRTKAEVLNSVLVRWECSMCVCEETCEIRQCQCGGSGSSHWSHVAQEVRSYREWKLRVPVFLSKSSLTKEHEQPTCHLISQTAHKNSYSGKKYY